MVDFKMSDIYIYEGGREADRGGYKDEDVGENREGHDVKKVHTSCEGEG